MRTQPFLPDEAWVETLLEAHPGQGRAPHVPQSLDLLGQLLALLSHHALGRLVLPQIGLGTYQDDGRLGAVVLQLFVGHHSYNETPYQRTLASTARQKKKKVLTSGTQVSVTLPNEVRAATEKHRRKMSVFW
jgi:hypothetical protein